jgi:hypothetical protein
MSLSPEELYLQLGNLIAEMPDLAHCPITSEGLRRCAFRGTGSPFFAAQRKCRAGGSRPSKVNEYHLPEGRPTN